MRALLGGRRDGDDPAGAERLGDLDRGGADAAGRPVHQHRLAGREPAALDEGEVGRAVVEDDRGTLLVRDAVGDRERQVERGDGLLGEATEQAQRGDPVAGGEPGAVGSADDLAGDLGARRERQVGLELVEPAALEHLGERDAGRAYADQDLVVGGFGAREVHELDR